MPIRHVLARIALAATAATTLATASSCSTPRAFAEEKPAEKCACDCVPNFPQIALPQVVAWNGAPLAQGPNTVFLVYSDGQPAVNYTVYRVEWTLQQIPEAVLVPAPKLPLFLDGAILATILIRFPNPPPPPIVPDDAVTMFEYAFRADRNNPM